MVLLPESTRRPRTPDHDPCGHIRSILCMRSVLRIFQADLVGQRMSGGSRRPAVKAEDLPTVIIS